MIDSSPCDQPGSKISPYRNQKKSTKGLDNTDITYIPPYSTQPPQLYVLTNTKGDKHESNLGKMIQPVTDTLHGNNPETGWSEGEPGEDEPGDRGESD